MAGPVGMAAIRIQSSVWAELGAAAMGEGAEVVGGSTRAAEMLLLATVLHNTSSRRSSHCHSGLGYPQRLLKLCRVVQVGPLQERHQLMALGLAMLLTTAVQVGTRKMVAVISSIASSRNMQVLGRSWTQTCC